MPDAYLIGHITIKDPAKWDAYRTQVPATLLPWHAELVFRGEAVVGKKVEWPSWKPTPEMVERNPAAYAKYAEKGMEGGPRNPLGARAIYLFQNGRDTAIRIHGTIDPNSIGHSVSNGCLRMVNEHVIDLYDRVAMGAKVTVV